MGLGSRRVGALKRGSNPFTFKTLPSLTPGPDSVDICAIARPGGNQIIFKPEIIFFIIVNGFYFFPLLRYQVCVYIYIYIINIKEIIYLSRDGKMREGCLRRGILLFPFLRPAGKENRG